MTARGAADVDPRPRIGAPWTTSPPRSPSSTDDDEFVARHIGPTDADVERMLDVDRRGVARRAARPDRPGVDPRRPRRSTSRRPRSEPEVLAALRELAGTQPRLRTSLIGMGYTDTITPRRDPAQRARGPGLVHGLHAVPARDQPGPARGAAQLPDDGQPSSPGCPIANASLLDEATAAAEAMAMARRLAKASVDRFVVHHDTHPQTIAVLRDAGRADRHRARRRRRRRRSPTGCFGALFSLPTSTGAVVDWRPRSSGSTPPAAWPIVATDLLACVLTTPPGQLGADIAVGSAQRFGVPMGFGGPHAAFIAAHEQAARALPGRLVGVSTDTAGRPALRLALQTREQHIRREKATSNICTAQVLLANIAGLYAAWHGPAGLRRIAERVHRLTSIAADALRPPGCALRHDTWFDTVMVDGRRRRRRDGRGRRRTGSTSRPCRRHDRRPHVRRDVDARRAWSGCWRRSASSLDRAGVDAAPDGLPGRRCAGRTSS